jgi:hypothetical protein
MEGGVTLTPPPARDRVKLPSFLQLYVLHCMSLYIFKYFLPFDINFPKTLNLFSLELQNDLNRELKNAQLFQFTS